MILQSDIRYHIDARVGAGAFGAVYRATMVTTGGLEKSVALKVLHPELATPGQVARLRDEAKLLSLVQHRAIVHVYDLVEFEVGWTVVMELVDGLDLCEICGHTTLPARAAVELIGEVASALHEAWVSERGGRPLRLVHRDIKPANLVLTPAGEVKLLDFGIANADADREAKTQTRHVVGTVRYMAPERFEGVCGPESDIYSLGIVLAELVGRGRVQAGDAEHTETIREVRRLAGDEVAELLIPMLSPDAPLRPTALDLSRTCRGIAGQLPGPSLVDWAMDTVEELADDRTSVAVPEDPLLGTTLTMAVSGRRPGARTVLLAGAVLAAAVVAAFVLGSLLTGSALLVGSGVGSETPYRIERITRLAGVPSDISGLNLSGDGTHVAYLADGEVFVLPIGGSAVNVTRDVQGRARAPVLSVDGDLVALSVDGRVEIRDLEGRLKRAIEVDARPADWEDELLLLSAGKASTVYAVGDGQPVVMGSGSGWEFARWAGPDRVLVSKGDSLRWLQRDGSTTDTKVAAYSADVTRDGRLVFADTDGKRSRLFVQSDAEATQQTELDGEVVEIASASEVDRIVFAKLKVHTRYRMLELEGNTVVGERVLPLPRDQEVADLMPDGESVAWMEINPNIDPGSRDTKVDYTLWRLSLDGEKLERIANVTAAAWPSYAGVSQDQTTRFQYQRLDESNGRFVAYSPMEPGDPVELVAMRRGLAHCFQLAPDGKSVAITDRDGFLHVLPTNAPIESLPKGETRRGWHTQHWAVDGSELYVIQRLEQNTLAAYDPSRKTFRELAERVDSVFVAGPDRLVVRRGEVLTLLDPRTGRESDFLTAKSSDVRIQFPPSGRTALLTEFLVTAEAYVAELDQPR